MLIAVWKRWVDSGQRWWLAVLVAILLADVLIGSWLIAWELRFLKEVMQP